MISALLLINLRGEIVLHRFYRDDVNISIADTFRKQIIASKEAGSVAPVQYFNNTSFLYIRHADIYLVAVTRKNANPMLTFQFLHQMVDIFKAYMGPDFNEESIRGHFTLVFELLDEIIDYGHPQVVAIEALKECINLGTQKKNIDDPKSKKLSDMLTGAVIDWRKEGIRHRKNQVFLDVLESVNLLTSPTGTVLKSDVSGQIMMKAQLSGMPECKLGLNDKVFLEKQTTDSDQPAKGRAVTISDFQFHRCVRLGKFNTDRSITFIPPDGAFELMKYRITENINLPFRVLPVIEEHGKTRVVFNVKAIGNFSRKRNATNIVMKIPTPPNTANCEIKVSIGKAVYEPEQRALIWKIPVFAGAASHNLYADVQLMRSLKEKTWVKPPISAQFQVPMFTSSGLHVRFLKVLEKGAYATSKWVRYITKGGQYDIRM